MTGVQTCALPIWIISIGNYAFERCLSLKKADIPSAIQHIGKNAFAETVNGNNWDVLETNLIGENIHVDIRLEIEGSFAEAVKCSKYTDVEYITHLKLIGRIDLSDLDYITASMPRITELDLSETSIKEIADNQFCGTRINKIILPVSLYKIGKSAFSDSKLKNIVIPYSVTEIG